MAHPGRDPGADAMAKPPTLILVRRDSRSAMRAYPLNPTNIQDKVDGGIGVYLLYRSDGGPVRYVGSSKDVAARLRDHVDEYRYFKVESHPNITQAYKREANLFHYHGGKEDLDNERHPPRPHRQVKCPRCSIHD